MASRTRRKPPHSRQDAAPLRSRGGEQKRLTEHLTVGWMLSMLTTLLCQVGALAVWLLSGDSEPLRAFAGYLFFAALILGLVSLLLGLAVLKLRTIRPPLGITIFAFAIAALPTLLVAAAATLGFRP